MSIYQNTKLGYLDMIEGARGTVVNIIIADW